MADQTVEELQAALDEATAKRESAEAEMRKAIKARDDAKSASRLSAEERTELDELRQTKADAEEARLKAEGEFDTLKAKADERVAAAEAKADAAVQAFANAQIEAAFHGAADLFGPTGRTTLTPDFACAGFRSHVKFDPGDNGAGGRLTVVDLKGEPILGEDGAPAPFADAMGRLIDAWPNKDAILRASGSTGSGARGSDTDLRTSSVTPREVADRAAAGDKDALDALREAPVAGQAVSGPGFARFQPKAS